MRIILLLLFISFGAQASTTSLPKADTTRIGTGTDVDLTLEFNNGLATKPYIKYDSVTNKFVQSSDGVSEESFGTQLSLKGNMVGFGTETEECVLDKTNGNILTVDSTATCGFDFKAPADGTLQGGYDASTQPQIVVDSTNLGMQIRDALVSISDKLLEVLSFDGLTNYFSVDTNGIALENGVSANGILDEDNLVSDSATSLATQQSIKAYVDASTPLSIDGDIYGFDSGSAYAIPGNACAEGEFLVRDDSVAGKWKCSSSIQGKFSQISDEVAYSPTYNGLSISNDSAVWHREGQFLVASGKFTKVSSSSATAKIELPSGLNVKTSLRADSSVVGVFMRNSATADLNDFRLMINTSDTTSVYVTVVNRSSYTAGDTRTWDEIISNADASSWEFKVPIEGWTNGLDGVVESKKLAYVEAKGNAGQTLILNVDPVPYIATDDVQNLWDGDEFTSNSKGAYTFSGTVDALGDSDFSIDLYTNISGAGYTKYRECSNEDLAAPSKTFNCTVKLDVGDKMAIRLDAGKTMVNSPTIHAMTIVQVNLDAVISATLQGINSSDIIIVTGSGNAGTSLTANVTNIDFTEVKDAQGAWDGTRFTALKTGMYLIAGYVDYTTNVSQIVNVWKNGVKDIAIGRNSGTISDTPISGAIYLEKDDYINFRINGSATLNNVSNHNITITQSADYEAIVKNLSLESDRCQTRKLTSDLEANSSDIADLKFINLEIGKLYSIKLKANLATSDGGNWIVNGNHNGVTILQHIRNSSGSAFEQSTTSDTVLFIATATTVIFETVSYSSGDSLVGDGTTKETHATLCYKGNTVTTTEFN